MDCILKVVYSNWFEVNGKSYPFANGMTKSFHQWAVDLIKNNKIHPSGEFDFINEINAKYFYQDPSSKYYFRNSNFYLHCKKSNIKFIREEEIKDDGSLYYFPIENECNTFSLIFKSDTYNFLETLSDDLRKHLKEGRVKLLISNMIDPCPFPEDIKELDQFLDNNDIKEAVLLTGNKIPNNFKHVKLVDSVISLYQTATDIDRFPYPSPLGYESDYVKADDLTGIERSKKFLCFNRFMNKHHRVGLAHLCLKYGLLEQGYFSFLYNLTDDYDYRLTQLNLPTLYANDIKNLIPYEIDTAHLPRNELSTFFSVTNYKKEFYINSYVHIVSETQFEQDFSPFFSEKTWRPILNLQPFIYVGNPFSLNTLKKLGFKTFHPFIDESYDEETNPIIRFGKIEKEIAKISLMTLDEINVWYNSIKEDLIYNQELLRNYKNYNPLCNLINLK